MLSVIYAKGSKIGVRPECRYAEFRYAECRGTVLTDANFSKKNSQKYPGPYGLKLFTVVIDKYL